MTTLAAPAFSIHDFLRQESEKDLLRFSTAGSVDDGKSTLIGRLLYDTQSVYEDQVRSIEGKGTTAPGQIDFALLTDGLRAEREQGITIDVAYRYFSTARRKFIIADTPGHEQYTRNMATGASTADAAVVLVDARKGVLVQSRRHAYIASLLRVRHVVVAVNKMDLIGYDEALFHALETDFRGVLDQIAAATGNPVEPVFVPLSALLGDNVVHPSNAMPWYHGPSLLEVLEQLPTTRSEQDAPFRMPVQRVLRPDHTFRGFAGQIASGLVRPGDAITVGGSGNFARIERIVTWDGDLQQATAPLSVTLVLDREVDISRGDLLASAAALPILSGRLSANIVWMDQQPLVFHHRYLFKHGSRTSPALVEALHHRANVDTLQQESSPTLELNSIGRVTIRLLHPLAFDAYSSNRSTGAFILIDPATNSTVAAGMIVAGLAAGPWLSEEQAQGPVTTEERAARYGHRAGVLELTGPASSIDLVERFLFGSGAAIFRIDAESDDFLLHPHLLDIVTSMHTRSGVLSIVTRLRDDEPLVARAAGEVIQIDSTDHADIVAAFQQLLRSTGISAASSLTASAKANPA
jgi:sulfate adenylyltransferase subunit 1